MNKIIAIEYQNTEGSDRDTTNSFGPLDDVDELPAEYWKENFQKGERTCTTQGIELLESAIGKPPYDIDIQIHREERGLWAVFLYPADDHNGAFGFNDNLCYQMLALVMAFPNLRWYPRVRSVADARRLLETLVDGVKIGDGELFHLVLGGHGSRESLLWSNEAPDGKLKVLTKAEDSNEEIEDDQTKTFFKVVENKLTKRFTHPQDGKVWEGRVVLDSCFHAEPPIKGSFAQYVADKLPGHRVYASKVSIAVVTDLLAVRYYPNFAVMIKGTSTSYSRAIKEQNKVWVGNCEPSQKDWVTQTKLMTVIQINRSAGIKKSITSSKED